MVLRTSKVPMECDTPLSLQGTPPPPPPHSPGAAVSVMSSGKPRRSRDPPAWSCLQWLGPDLVHHVSDCTLPIVSPTPWHVVGPAVAATACG